MAKKPEPNKSTCISCGIGEVRLIGTLPVTVYSGVSPTGTPYSSIHRTRHQCSSCGQVKIVTE